MTPTTLSSARDYIKYTLGPYFYYTQLIYDWLTWVVTAYVLATMTMVSIVGKLSE